MSLEEKLKLDRHAAAVWRAVRDGDPRTDLSLSDVEYQKRCRRWELRERRRRGGAA